jgi:hypothetical protein
MARVAKPAKMGVNKWDEELAKEASISLGIEEGTLTGGKFLTVNGSTLMYNGAEVPGGKINLIILDHILHNVYYKPRYDGKGKPIKFDRNDIHPPVCYAFGCKLEEMKPHESCSEPQHPTCEGCPQSEWGTADTGKGKACKNIRRLACITEDAIESVSEIENAQVAFFQPSVTNTKAWAGYVQQLATVLKKPPFAVVTELSVKFDEHTLHKLQFKLISAIEDGDILAALRKRKNELASQIVTPYPAAKEEEVTSKKTTSKKLKTVEISTSTKPRKF